jgi:flagellar basal-body rod protein FlgF
MLRGLYTAAAGIVTNMVATDTMANNLANVNTVGFKRNGVNFKGFAETIINRAQNGQQTNIGSLMGGSQVHRTAIHFDQGALKPTGNPLDLAIQGRGFFQVKTEEGQTYYTRNGSFSVNEAGYLITQNGDYVQGEGGNIQLPQTGQPIEVTPQGTINVGSNPVGRVRVVHFADEFRLEKMGESQFKAPPGLEESQARFTVVSGQLEHSNVNPIRELVNSVTGLRLYEALERNIRFHNDTLQKAVNEVGRVRG